VLIVDDILLSLYRQVAERYRFEKVIVFPFGGEPIPDDCANYETLIAPHLGKPFTPAPHDENDPIALCYTSGTTGRPKGVAYSHRSTVLHSLNACLPDYWGLPMFHGLDQIRDGADRARARIREAGHCRKRSAHH
jgi:fatty-acyl-CoA synthase